MDNHFTYCTIIAVHHSDVDHDYSLYHIYSSIIPVFPLTVLVINFLCLFIQFEHLFIIQLLVFRKCITDSRKQYVVL